MTSTRPVRLTVVLSGGASLGAYHAGVLAGLVTARNAVADPGRLRIDAIGGASAGALVGLLGAWAIAAGRDPVRMLREAWVERVDIDLLRGEDGRAPLDFDRLRERFVELLDEAPSSGAIRDELTVQVSLTGLRGMTYPVRGLRGADSIRAATYADWFAQRLGADVILADVTEPVDASLLDAALASAANPGGFAPRLLDRTTHRDLYEQHGIEDLPEPLTLWFSDGGLVQSEPVGRVVGMAEGSEAAQRVAVLVDARSEDPGAVEEWSDPERAPHWVAGLQRGLAILPAHEIYEDLRRLERDNARLRWVERLTEELVGHLDESARGGLRTVLAEIAEAEAHRRPAGHRPGLERPDGDTLDAHLRAALGELAGVRGKEQVEADVITPLLLLDEGASATTLLAGEILGDFGGFLDRSLRASDFDLGYASAHAWVRDGLARTDLSDEDVAAAVVAVERAHSVDWRRTNRGGVAPADLGHRARAAGARLGLQLLRVTLAELTGVERLAEPVRAGAGRALTGLRRVVDAARSRRGPGTG